MTEKTLNLRGLKCPLPALRTRKALEPGAVRRYFDRGVHRSSYRRSTSRTFSIYRRHAGRHAQGKEATDVPDPEEVMRRRQAILILLATLPRSRSAQGGGWGQGVRISANNERPNPLPRPRYARPTSPLRGEVKMIPFPQRALRARAMSNSDIVLPAWRPAIMREAIQSLPHCPPASLRLRSPGTNRNKGSGTPANAGLQTRTSGCGARHGRSGLRRAFRYRARSPAGVPPRLFPRGVWSLGAIRARFRGQTVQGGGGAPPATAHFQRRTSHAGRNAGRHDARTAREQG